MPRKMIKQDERYHDTLLLLKKYRDVVWSLSVSVEHAKSDFRECFGENIDDFLESVYVAGADLSGTDIEERAKCIERSNKMLQLVDSAVAMMRNKHKHGELYYQVLYYNFLCEHEYGSLDDVLEALNEAGIMISRRTMFDYRTHAINLVSTYLWGYTAKDTQNILAKFIKE